MKRQLKAAIFMLSATLGTVAADDAPPIWTWEGFKHNFSGFEREHHFYGPLGYSMNHFVHQMTHYPVFERPDVVEAGKIVSDLAVNSTETTWQERNLDQSNLFTNASTNTVTPMIRYGLTSNIELTLAVPQMSRSGTWDIREREMQLITRRPKKGFGDIILGAKLLMMASDDRDTVVSLRVQVEPSTAQETKLLSNGEPEGSVDILFQKRFGRGLALYGSIGGVYATDIDTGINIEIDADPYAFGSLGVEIPFRVGSLIVQGHAAEAPYQHPFDHLDNTIYEGFVGWAFRLSQKQAFKIGVSTGSHSSSPDSHMIAQVTQEF